MREVAGAVTLVEEPPEIEFRNGLFYVTHGAQGVCRAMRPEVMQQSIAAAAVCYREFRTRQSAKIIKIRDHAASS